LKISPRIPQKAQGRSDVLGVGITPLNLELAEECLLAGGGCPGFSGYVTITGVHGVVESQDDEELKRIHNASFLSTPDGMPMVWIGRWNGFAHMDRVYGPEFMLNILATTCQTGESHYFFGGADGVAQDLGKKMGERFPNLNVAGTYTPPFRPLTEEEEKELLAELQRTKPHFLWVGLSTPKQERFMAAFLEKYSLHFSDWPHGFIMIGVGAAFDFHTGRVVQAPRWIQRSGFEWLFRVCMDPKRLWKRYAVGNFRFITQVIPDMIRSN
jgi:N-acetylglucosaminyldiphosphoundecaprenol N-acetyl-beta-D-mannosaminyltransferase